MTKWSMSAMLEGAKAIVTGGAQGLGWASARTLASAGARVCIADINEEKAQSAVAELPGQGHLASACDVSDATSRAACIREVALAFGDELHVLVNNAGIHHYGQAEEMEEESWRRLFDVNVHGMMFMARDAAPLMLRHKKGSIINIGSIASILAMPQRAAYTATKTAVLGVTRALAVEWAERGIRVNAVGPGYHWTPLMEQYVVNGVLNEERLRKRIPAGRIGTTEDVGKAVLFFASPLSEYVTGQLLMVDGGYTTFGAPGDASG